MTEPKQQWQYATVIGSRGEPDKATPPGWVPDGPWCDRSEQGKGDGLVVCWARKVRAAAPPRAPWPAAKQYKSITGEQLIAIPDVGPAGMDWHLDATQARTLRDSLTKALEDLAVAVALDGAP